MERSRMFPQAQGITDNNNSSSDMVWTPWWTGQYNPELWRAALYRRASETEINLGSGQLHLPTHPDNSAAPKTVINSDTTRRVSTPVKRKRGSPWTPQEHRAFLRGLEEHGKGDWKSIARYCVVSKTSTQVASHAQKYFLRNDGVNKKKRASIHDITLESEHVVEVDQQQHKPEPKPENPIQQLHNDSVPHQQNTIRGWLKEIDLPDLVEDQPQKSWSYNYNNLPNNWDISEDPFYCQMLQDSQMMHFKPPQDNANMPPYMRG